MPERVHQRPDKVFTWLGQQLHCLALKLLRFVSFLYLLFFHGLSHFTLRFRVRQIGGGSAKVRRKQEKAPEEPDEPELPLEQRNRNAAQSGGGWLIYFAISSVFGFFQSFCSFSASRGQIGGDIGFVEPSRALGQ